MKQLNINTQPSKAFVVDPRLSFRPPTASLLMLAIVVICGGVVAAWFTSQGSLHTIMEQMQLLPINRPAWLQLPMTTLYTLSQPVVALPLGVFAVAFSITKISPQPQAWSRFLVVALLLILTFRYVVWRSLSTLNLSDVTNSVFSVGLFILEMLTIFNGVLQLFLMVRTKDRRHQADLMAQAVERKEYLPSVDILIPTYNEPEFILRRTIIGCQALDYDRKTIYVLDDTRRPEIKALAMELGCEYITRPDNQHAKAGNLNHAIARTNGELIVCFDADFIPTRNFLTRTVGFFQDHNTALVQTPQSFYSVDPIARNLGLENILVPEQEAFYRQIQPVRDGTDSVVCAGTSFVMRRSALQSSGGEFVTSSLSEDYFTAISLSGKGYRLIYLDEKLSAGAAPDDMGAQATQRLRWAQGTLQAFFIKENPLTIAGLRPLQRISHLTGILHWFTSLSRVGFLLIPLATAFIGVIPVRASTDEILYYFLPLYIVNLTVFAWLSNYSRSAFLSDIYDVVLCFPLAATVIQTLFQPFSKGFKVTPKGTNRDRLSFNWTLASPLVIVFIATAVSLWINLGMCVMELSSYDVTDQVKGLNLGWLWSTYNLVLLGIALLVMLDVPKPNLYEWFDLRRVVKIQVGDRNFWGTTAIISEVGAEIVLTQSGIQAETEVNLEIMEESLKLNAYVYKTSLEGGFPVIKVAFNQVSLTQHRCLVEMLFCRPGQWKHQNNPSEIASLWLLFRSLVKPKALFGRKNELSAISICQI
ncbi:glycosyl transferase [Synechococcus sp. PCC 7502]|uniref:glycosyltransferase family 2 protein n=1 Tax=Synechococcus sp. PCC 7502 TaxID=1173263 RepID=UPI00029FAA5A|nr:cellulose synthase catalytic subunit [Synechococcus sp. PCC 7502]AFY73075.1 glycosyl transferase [Synechococcus sp. PCC 7502]